MQYMKTGSDTFKIIAGKEEIEGITETSQLIAIMISDYVDDLKAEICNTEEFINHPSNIYFELIAIKEDFNSMEGQYRYLVSSNDVRLLKIADETNKMMEEYDCPEADEVKRVVEKILEMRRYGLKYFNDPTHVTSNGVGFIDRMAKHLLDELIDELNELGLEIKLEDKEMPQNHISEKTYYFDSLKSVIDASINLNESEIVYKFNENFVLLTNVEDLHLYDFCKQYIQLSGVEKSHFLEHATEIACIGDIRKLIN